MNPEQQYLKYLDWLQDRGQSYPATANRARALLVHSEPQLSDTKIKLMDRIAAACGFTAKEICIAEASSLGAPAATPFDHTALELMVAFGDQAIHDCRHWATTIGMSLDSIVEGTNLDRLEGEATAKRDLWQRLQSHVKARP